MSYIGKKPSFSQVRTAELVVQRGTDITTAGTVAALDVSNISLVRLTAATVLQGLVAPVSPATNGKRVTLVNANSVSLTVSNESGSASASDRISTGISRDLVITAGASVTLFYNTASSRWSVESSSSEINIDRLQVATEAIVLNSVDLAPTSSPKSGLIELTAGSQTSFRSISTGANGQFLAIINKTGSLLQIANEDSGATAGNRIVTGTGGPISLQNNASLFLAYLGSASRWQVVGGTGSGGGATEQVTQTGIGSLAVGTPLYVDAVNGWVEANASASNTAEVAGMVGRSLSANLAEIVMAGEVSGVAASRFTENALPARGEVVFLSTTSGKLTITEPSVIGQVSKPLGIVHNVGATTVDIMFYNMRGAVVGGANARTTISLGNNAVTTVQNALAYDAGELSGWVYIDATTDLRFYVQAQFAKNGAGTNYNLSFQTTGDTPPAGFTVGITAGGLIQVTLPSLAGFSSASINFGLNVAAVGATLPLAISPTNISGTGDIAMQAGYGISFGNEVLKHYDEGTWIPGVSFGGNSVGVTYGASRYGHYTRIGNRCFFNCYVVLTSRGSSAGLLRITGLPFISAIIPNGGYSSVSFWFTGISVTNGITQGYVDSNAQTISLDYIPTNVNAGSAQLLSEGFVSNTAAFMVSGSYIIA